MSFEGLGENIIESVVFALIGIGLLGVGFLLFVKLAPFSVRKEIEEDHNTALGIILAAVILGIALIVAASVHGG